MSEKMLDMHDWVNRKSNEKIENFDCNFSKAFGFVTMSNGKEAQIKVVLELDEDEWD